MVNHIQTLLLNTSAATVTNILNVSEYGYIDPFFTEVALDANIASVYRELFPENLPLRSKLDLVRLYMNGLGSPEFLPYVGEFDTRTTGIPAAPDNVFAFYSSISGTTIPIDPVSSRYAPSAFLPTTVAALNPQLVELQKIYVNSPESVKRLTALILAVTFHLEASRLSSLSK